MKQILVFILGVALATSAATAAMELSYTLDGNNTIVTAVDGPTTYWEMVVDTGSSRPGRIMSFIDKSGLSSDTFSYAFTYHFGSGFIDGMDNGGMRDVDKWTISDIVMGASAMTYTLSRDLTRDDGAATYSMEYTIGLPAVTPTGYATNINILNAFYFDVDWAGRNGDARVRSIMRLAGSADNDEYTVVTHNGVADGDPAVLMVEATVTDADPAMAAGSTFTQTLTYDLFDTAYASATGNWSTWAGPHLLGYTDLGVTGTWAGNPGAAGSERTYTAEIDVDINIVPEPATIGLLGLGGLALFRRRR